MIPFDHTALFLPDISNCLPKKLLCRLEGPINIQFCCDPTDGTCCDSDDCRINWECVPNGCTGGPETAKLCVCATVGEGYEECAVQKIYHTCICTNASCQNTYRVEWNIGSSYLGMQSAPGRRCAGASYCDVSNTIGVDYIDDNTCYIAYSGCD